MNLQTHVLTNHHTSITATELNIYQAVLDCIAIKYLDAVARARNHSPHVKYI